MFLLKKHLQSLQSTINKRLEVLESMYNHMRQSDTQINKDITRLEKRIEQLESTNKKPKRKERIVKK